MLTGPADVPLCVEGALRDVPGHDAYQLTEPLANRVAVAVNTMPVDSVNEQVTTSLPLAFRLLITDPAAALTIVWLVFWPVTVLAMPLPTCV